MAALADIQQVKRMLSASGEVFDDATDSRLTAINEAVSAMVEQRLGRGFGAVEGTSVRIFTSGSDGAVLFSRPVRSVTDVTVGGTWDGATYSGATALTASQYQLGSIDPLGRAYKLLTPYVHAPVVVTGIWSDTDTTGTVPADVVYAVNYLVTEQYKQEQAGPAGFKGPDGSVVRPANPWNHQLVKDVLVYHGTSCAVTL